MRKYLQLDAHTGEMFGGKFPRGKLRGNFGGGIPGVLSVWKFLNSVWSYLLFLYTHSFRLFICKKGMNRVSLYYSLHVYCTMYVHKTVFLCNTHICAESNLLFIHSFIHCRHLYSASSSGATQKRSQSQRGRIMLF